MNENVDYKLDIDKMWGKKIARFLWKCAGGDEQIMKYASYYDHMKMMGIGGIVLGTSVLACLAMGFAIQTIFGSWYATIPVALVWGLIIFNLDRFIVSSTGKGDGSDSVTWKEFVTALPRLIMAFFIGIAISAPLETVIFGTEIEREWDEARTQLALKKRFDLNKEFDNDGTYVAARAKIISDSTLMVRYQRNLDSVTNILLNTGCTRNPCPTHQHYLDYQTNYQKRLNLATASYQADTAAISSYSVLRKQKLQAASDSIKRLQPGFLDKLMMLHRLSWEGKTIPEYDSKGQKIKEAGVDKTINVYGKAWKEIWAVRLLFLLLEITPVLIKMFLVKSAYDYMQDNVTQILIAKQGIYYEPLKDENGKIIWAGTNHNPKRIVEVIEHQNELEKRNAKEAITVFADEEMKKIQDDPSQFFDDNGKKRP
jgi:hypothetical protein